MKKHLTVILVVIFLSLIVFLAIKYSVVVKYFWLWVIGLASPLTIFFKSIKDKVAQYVGSIAENNKENYTVQPANTQKDTTTNLTKAANSVHAKPVQNQETDTISDTQTLKLNVFRYTDDGDTTLGLLYMDNTFVSYTLEDSYHETKIYGQTRIPAGTYKIDFIKQITELTKTYRDAFPWFDYHLEIKNVPGFTGVYIHNGGTSKDTMGCLLVASGLFDFDHTKMLKNSVVTYTSLYKTISEKLKGGYEVSIQIMDEDWNKYLAIN